MIEQSELLTHAETVAAALTDVTDMEWTAALEYRHAATLSAPSGHPEPVRIWLNGRSGRIEVSGQYPKRNGQSSGPREWGAISHDDSPPSISYSISRPVHVIARDIDRRFLSVFLPLLAACWQRKAEADQWDDDRTATAQRLADTAGLSVNNGPEWTRDDTPQVDLRPLLGEGYGDIIIHGPDSIEFKLRSVPPDKAETILQALRGAR